MNNSADADKLAFENKLASSEANWSGSTLFSKGVQQDKG